MPAARVRDEVPPVIVGDLNSMSSAGVKSATVLIAHGSRRAEANRELSLLADQVRARLPGERIEIAFLELAEPTIPEAVRHCVEAGAGRVRLFPYFLSPGVHVARDLEGYRADFAVKFPDVEFVLCPPLGQHAGIVDIVLDRLAESG